MMLKKQPNSSASPVLLVSVMFIAYLLSYGDRVVFSLTLTPMQEHFGFTDTQLGLLSGLAFAVSYAFFSPIVGILVDRFSRKKILSGAISGWSICSFFTAFANSFWFVGLARAGVGIGESAVHPLAVSLFGDTVSDEKRGKYFGIYLSSGAIGTILTLLFGGLIIQYLSASASDDGFVLFGLKPWQMMYVFSLIPGILLAIIILIFLKEPQRRNLIPKPQSLHKTNSVVLFVKNNPRLMAAIYIGSGLLQMGGYATSLWVIVFLERKFGWSSGESGVRFALTGGIAMLIGCLLVGRIIDFFKSLGYQDATMRVCLLAGICYGTFSIIAFLVSGIYTTMFFLTIAFLVSWIPQISLLTMLAEVIPAELRGRMTGISTVCNGIIMNSIGPFLVGLFSDTMFLGDISKSLALTTIIGMFCGSIIILSGLKAYKERVVLISVESSDSAGAEIY